MCGRVSVCACVRVCLHVFVYVCVWVLASNFFVVGLQMHHNGLIRCGVFLASAVWWRPDRVRVLWSRPCKPTKG